MLDKDIDSKRMLVVLLVDGQSFFVETMLNSNFGNVSDFVVLKLVDVSNDFAFISTNCCEKEEVLEVFVVAEWRRLDDNLLQELNKFNRKIGLEKSLDSHGDIIGVSTFWKGCSDNLDTSSVNANWIPGKINLVDKRTTMDIVMNKNLGPEVGFTALDEISGLLLEHGVVIGDGDKFIVAKTFGISNIGQIWIACLAELSNDQWLIQLNEWSDKPRMIRQ